MVNVKPIEDYHELRDKGGILGKINLRIYFLVIPKDKSILVLGAVKKESDKQTPNWIKIRIRSRLRKFRNGDFGCLV